MNDIAKGYENILNDFKLNKSSRVRRQVNNVLKLLELSGGQKILEVGTATGKFTALMSRRNSVVALDLSKENLDRASKTVDEMGNPANVKFVQGNCASTPFDDNMFDKIAAIDIIEHLTDEVFDGFCKESYRLLKTGGHLYIYTPNLLHPYELTRPFRPVMRKEHIGVRTMRKICMFLRKHNFVVEKSYYNNLFRRISVKAGKRI